MPKSDTWPGGIAMESVTGMDSAGSRDSMVSINSGFSDDSFGHLSAEEKATLMYLEETIEALEVEDDSGLSSDEPDRSSHDLAGKNINQPSIDHSKPEELLAHEDPNQVMGRDHKPSEKYLVPVPLLLASGNDKLTSRPVESSPKEQPVAILDVPDGFRSHSYHQQTGQAVSEGTASSNVVTAKPSIGLSSDVIDLPPSFIPEPPVRTNLPSDSNSKESSPKSLDVKSQQKPQKASSKIPVGFIPPPSDFTDEPAERSATTHYSPLPTPVFDEPPEWTPELPKTKPKPGVGLDEPAEMSKSQSFEPETSRGPLFHNDLENLRKKASMKKAPHLTPLMVGQHASADKPMTPSTSSEHVPGVPKEYSDPKSPPVVAPKPKKLPSNIILKSHKDTGAAHSLLPQSDRTPLDPQKTRMEALRKLGLLKSEEVVSVPNISSNRLPTFKAKDTPISSNNPSIYMGAPKAEPVQDSRQAESPIPGVVQSQIDMPKLIDAASREGSIKKQPSIPFEVKSASLERSGVGLSSIVIEPTAQAKTSDKTNIERRSGVGRNSIIAEPTLQGTNTDKTNTERQSGVGRHSIAMKPTLHAANPDKTNVELSPGQLRKNQSQPPSAGSAKDFGIGHPADDSNKSLHAASVQPSQPGNNSQKLPRSNGISVLITPHGKNGENRQDALKKLGLLRK
ncbi:specifically androgen-regulated gene protein [Xyrauchen texanus]|uniref:specifically androgen-regulated gene protein n=1 Tax=Xyrauchen texanus TaxID=154827 RepID=UPI00224235B6|nr:specifically androgen-regulated gene protein [Xyrauchen texanus]XP_051947834.1 specifically androgen-regulated gene protein [Xyrauchen texanus]